ncbi:YdeI/OmpD-associated family protein [Aquirufa rosea]|uniref:Bacteriocin-protection protein, YdeI/OmpD-associated family n=1 Tax=Aquirufa rosea TaxID=2509241 RepID=A0A4Q1C1G1_9BACT|nr:YdeI/OmpD-associated family protein [Aquirufa rosea]RXK50995.1 bacteriocin-protection protein, YdeI/OmpD-associated family [Aquirufa rosea]
MEIVEFQTPQKWREWLEKNHLHSKGICLKISKVKAPESTISYQEALDEALCFGWIDSQKLPLNEHYWLQKFGPRKAKSIWSKTNIAHVERLIKSKKMSHVGLKSVNQAKQDGRWDQAYDTQSQMIIPDDFLVELQKNESAERFFKTLNRSNLFAIYFKLHSAKKPETRKKRMDEIMAKLSRGEKFH